MGQDKKRASEDEKRESDKVAEVNAAIAEQEKSQSPWKGLRSRISRYYIKTKEFPEWREEDEGLAFLSCSMSGQAIHSNKDPSKVRFRVHRYFRVMEEILSDRVDFDKEDEAIDFMLQKNDIIQLEAGMGEISSLLRLPHEFHELQS